MKDCLELDVLVMFMIKEEKLHMRTPRLFSHIIELVNGNYYD